MTDHLKRQAKRLRERLARKGIDIKHGLSLELIAAVHDKPNWDTLCATGVADGVLAPGPIPLSCTSFGGPTPIRRGSITSVTGPSGSGKSVVRAGLPRTYAEELGMKVIGAELSPQAAHEQLSELKRLTEAAAEPACLVLDEVSSVTMAGQNRRTAAEICRWALGGDRHVVLLGQSRRDVELLVQECAGHKIEHRRISIDSQQAQ